MSSPDPQDAGVAELRWPISSRSSGMLTQVLTLDPEATIRKAVLGDLPEHVWAGDPRIRDILDGLLGGIDAPDVGGLEAIVGPLSGGERRRLALAGLLAADPDLLPLDEPTNHLDVEGVASVSYTHLTLPTN